MEMHAECTYCHKHWNNDFLTHLLFGHAAHVECHDKAMKKSNSPYRRLRWPTDSSFDSKIVKFNRGPHAVQIKVTTILVKK